MSDAGGFYGKAMELAGELQFAQARLVQGIGDEIAVARSLLFELVKNPKVDPEVVMKAAELIGELVAIEFRTSRHAQEGLSENLAGVFRAIAELTAAPS